MHAEIDYKCISHHLTSSECSVMVVLMSPLSLACCSASWWRNTKILGILAECYSLCGSVIVIQSLPVATNTGLTPSDDRGQVEILKVELRWAAQCCCLGRFSLFPSNIPRTRDHRPHLLGPHYCLCRPSVQLVWCSLVTAAGGAHALYSGLLDTAGRPCSSARVRG